MTGVEAPTGRQALLSPGLAAELGAAADEGCLLRVQKPSAIPADTLAGRRSDTSRAVRLTTRGTLAPDRMGEFTLRPQQDAVRAVFVPIARLQRDLELAGSANVLLLAAQDGADAGSPSVGAAAGRARRRLPISGCGWILRTRRSTR